MPSPFPGMDPYLEDPFLWPDVHHTLISVLREMLNAQLRPRYVARIEERIFVSDALDPGRGVIIPDVSIIRAASGGAARQMTAAASAVAEPVEATTLIEDEIHEARIELIDDADKSVVAVIEILSPTNKIPSSRGQESYRQKRNEIMHSPAHLIEIDLLRQGSRFLPDERLAPHDYLVHVSRADKRPKGWLWPIGLEQRLPVIPLPLRGNDPDAPIDLQQVLDVSYERAGYNLVIDYNRPPVSPLPAQQQAWAAGQIRAHAGQ